MTISHLMGEKTKAEMEKYVTLSTPNLLFSTLHVGHEDRFSVDSDKSDLCSVTSKISGVDLFSESGSEADHNAMENFVDNPDKVSTPALLDSPSIPRSNLISQVLNRGMNEEPTLTANIVTEFPEGNPIQRDTTPNSIRTNPQFSPFGLLTDFPTCLFSDLSQLVVLFCLC